MVVRFIVLFSLLILWIELTGLTIGLVFAFILSQSGWIYFMKLNLVEFSISVDLISLNFTLNLESIVFFDFQEVRI